MSFEFLGLSDALLEAVKQAGYTEPTPIQKKAIPAILQGRNVLGIAQTGTGKTASFTLPMIDILAEGRAKARVSRTLILEPTRELAAQVAESFEKYGKQHKLTKALLIGGVSYDEQERLLDRGVDVLIATPGRMLDHFERGNLLLTGVEIFVVDEADRMLDMGFIPDVEKIWGLMPQKPQALFFSATMPPPIKKLTDRFLDDPKLIEASAPATTAETVEQFVHSVAPRDKMAALKQLLSVKEVTNALVFCNRKKEVKAVATALKRAKFNADQLHGDMSQPERLDVLDKFKTGDFHVLCASDVAARGLDIPKVSHVFNFDVPPSPDDYVHRIGRTGRAGRKGKAIMLVTRAEQKYLDSIEKLIKMDLKPIDPETLTAKDGGAAKDTSGKHGEKAERLEDKTPRDTKAGNKKRDQGKGKVQGKDQDQSKDMPRDQKKDPPQKAKSGQPRKDEGKKGQPEKSKDGQQKKSGRKGDKQQGFGDHIPAFFMQDPEKADS